MLYLVATPIGNLKDITHRALEVLSQTDYILCEDTRHSVILLKHYSIQKPLVSFHKFSEASKEDSIIADLKDGKTICLISDAGTPGISDPGTRLVQRCVQEDLEVFSIPGPCALIAALSSSGLDTSRFQFLGFLPKQSSALKDAAKEFLIYPYTSICYESPERIENLLKIIHEFSPERQLVVARELTKKFEEFIRGTPSQILMIQQEQRFKGEIVLLIEGFSGQALNSWEDLSVEELVTKIQNENQCSLNEAIKKVAEIRSVPKRQIYNQIHGKK